jgi:hypothetical protein
MGLMLFRCYNGLHIASLLAWHLANSGCSPPAFKSPPHTHTPGYNYKNQAAHTNGKRIQLSVWDLSTSPDDFQASAAAAEVEAPLEAIGKLENDG